VVSGDDHGAADGFVVSFAAGSRIAGYRLEERIGQGGMAVVFRARDERLGRLVALKILAPALAGDAEFQRRFIRESQAAAAIDDPHIVPVFAAGEADGVLFIAMRYVADGDAQSLLNREGPLPPGRVLAIISPVASGLDAAHRAGLVHRDVKPSNMLIDVLPGRPDHVYLSDFGLSKAVASTSGMTRAGMVMGTLDYISPEQIAGKPVDGRTDQYALACSAFELLAGVPPFRRDEPTAMMYAHLSESPPQLTSRRPGLPPAVDAVLSKALAKAPGDRYASCGQFADALHDAFGAQPYRSGDWGMSASAHPPAETAGPAAQAAAQPIDPAVGLGVAAEDARAVGHPLGSYDQTPATPAGTVSPVVTPAAPPTVLPSLAQGAPPPSQDSGGAPTIGYAGSSGAEAPTQRRPRAPGRPTQIGTGNGVTSPSPGRRNRSRIIAAAVAVVAGLYFAVAAVAHTPPFTEPARPVAGPTHSPANPPTPTPSPSLPSGVAPRTQLFTGTSTGIGTLNLVTGAESGSFTGYLSPLGAVTGHENLTFTFPSASTFSYTGTRTAVTASGDEVFSRIQGSGTSGTSTSHATETDTITGGTGRFTGASGTFTVTISSVFSVAANTETFHTTSTTHGNIRY
jgi:serine/threonine-protein kinase